MREATPANGGHLLRLTVQGDLRDILHVAASHDATNLVAHEPSLEEVFLRFYEGEASGAGLSRWAVDVAEGGAASGEGLSSAAPAGAGAHSSEPATSNVAAPR